MMSETILVTTQAEMNAAIERQEGDPLVRIEVCGSASVIAYGSARVYAYDSATVYAYGSANVTALGSASVIAFGSATVTAFDSVTVTALGSATVSASGSARVSAFGSARVHASDSATVSAYGSANVTASGSATVYASGSARVTAYDSATVTASGSATVNASRFVTILRQSPRSMVTGGQVPDLSTPLGWCEYTGAAEASPGTRILYKGLDAEFRSGHGTAYLPGTEIVAPDWDGGAEECGGGFHFCAHPAATLQFIQAVKFVACEVGEADMAAHEFPLYPNKIKARACRVLYECDVHGERVVK